MSCFQARRFNSKSSFLNKGVQKSSGSTELCSEFDIEAVYKYVSLFTARSSSVCTDTTSPTISGLIKLFQCLVTLRKIHSRPCKV